MTVGQELPPAQVLIAEQNAVLIWEGPPQTLDDEGNTARKMVALVTSWEPYVLGGFEHPVDVQVRGTLGEIQWVGDPGVGEVKLAWNEGVGPCDSYALHLWDVTLTEEETGDYLRDVAGTL